MKIKIDTDEIAEKIDEELMSLMRQSESKFISHDCAKDQSFGIISVMNVLSKTFKKLKKNFDELAFQKKCMKQIYEASDKVANDLFKLKRSMIK